MREDTKIWVTLLESNFNSVAKSLQSQVDIKHVDDGVLQWIDKRGIEHNFIYHNNQWFWRPYDKNNVDPSLPTTPVPVTPEKITSIVKYYQYEDDTSKQKVHKRVITLNNQEFLDNLQDFEYNYNENIHKLPRNLHPKNQEPSFVVRTETQELRFYPVEAFDMDGNKTSDKVAYSHSSLGASTYFYYINDTNIEQVLEYWT